MVHLLHQPWTSPSNRRRPRYHRRRSPFVSSPHSAVGPRLKVAATLLGWIRHRRTPALLRLPPPPLSHLYRLVNATFASAVLLRLLLRTHQCHLECPLLPHRRPASGVLCSEPRPPLLPHASSGLCSVPTSATSSASSPTTVSCSTALLPHRLHCFFPDWAAAERLLPHQGHLH